jgi:type I restriction enzyme M protein
MHSLLEERVGLKAELERLEGEMEKCLKELGYVQ